MRRFFVTRQFIKSISSPLNTSPLPSTHPLSTHPTNTPLQHWHFIILNWHHHGRLGSLVASDQNQVARHRRIHRLRLHRVLRVLFIVALLRALQPLVRELHRQLLRSRALRRRNDHVPLVRPRVHRPLRLDERAHLVHALLREVLLQVVERHVLAVRLHHVRAHAQRVLRAVLRLTRHARAYAHRLLHLLLEHATDLVVRLDLLVQEVHATLRHHRRLLRLEQAAQIREDHAVARRQPRAHVAVGEYVDRHAARAVRGALRRSLHDHLLDLLQLGVVVEQEVALVQLGHRVVVQVQELCGCDVESVFVGLGNERLQVLLVALTARNHIDRRVLRFMTNPQHAPSQWTRCSSCASASGICNRSRCALPSRPSRIPAHPSATNINYLPPSISSAAAHFQSSAAPC